jgi:hypothetical protein
MNVWAQESSKLELWFKRYGGIKIRGLIARFFGIYWISGIVFV